MVCARKLVSCAVMLAEAMIALMHVFIQLCDEYFGQENNGIQKHSAVA